MQDNNMYYKIVSATGETLFLPITDATNPIEQSKEDAQKEIASMLDKLASMRDSIQDIEQSSQTKIDELFEQIWKAVEESLPTHREQIIAIDKQAQSDKDSLAINIAKLEADIKRKVASLGKPVKGVWLRATPEKPTAKWNLDKLDAFAAVYPVILNAKTEEQGKVKISEI